MSNHPVARSLHDVGVAAWFGGSLMGAVGLNAAAGAVSDPSDSGRVANEGWNRWTPVNAAAIGAHLAGASVLLVADRERVAKQQGVASMSAVKAGLTVAALGITAYSRVQGRVVNQRKDVPVSSGSEPSVETPADVASAQRKLRALQWAIPALTGAVIVVSAYAGEQQRSSEVLKGVAKRLNPLS